MISSTSRGTSSEAAGTVGAKTGTASAKPVVTGASGATGASGTTDDAPTGGAVSSAAKALVVVTAIRGFLLGLGNFCCCCGCCAAKAN